MGRIHPEGCELDSSLFFSCRADAPVWVRQEPDDEDDDEDEEEEHDRDDDDSEDDDEGDGYSE